MDALDVSFEQVALAGFVNASSANGPGRRIVIWVQGCSIGCPGCFNPTTHARTPPKTPVAELAERVLSAVTPEIAGVTFSGGEPFEQASALATLARRLRAGWPDGTLMAYSGYTLKHLESADAPEGSRALLTELDYLVDGPFEVRSPGSAAWQASTNQRLRVLGRPLPPGADAPGEGHIGEFHVLPNGGVLLSGLPDPKLKSILKTIT